ncbi:hypothetical protein V8J88_19605 [Massilia sp. W12]|uniref:hypothetical protein n=1 Tax=Massilia sp. W12 TaxID=3126507 RepID=UPI0030CDD3DB
MDQEIVKLLYTNEDGEIDSLRDAQLMEEVDEARADAVCTLLSHADVFIRYQALLLALAWGRPQALQVFHALLAQAPVFEFALEPDRIYGHDNYLDEMALAFYYYAEKTGEVEEILPVCHRFLALYPQRYFKSHFKYVLQSLSHHSLAADMSKAIHQSLKNSRVYQASQLLPPLAKHYAKSHAQLLDDLIHEFMRLPADHPNQRFNVAEALRYLPQENYANLMQWFLLKETEPGVIDEAKRSLEVWRQQGVAPGF